MIRIGVCDDEKLQVKVNGVYISEIAERNRMKVDIKGFTSAERILEYLKTEELDMVFLDIDMGEKESGIVLAQKLTEMFPKMVIVFITGHGEFALDAYNIEALGYLTKPIEEGKMERIFKKAVVQVHASKIESSNASIVITIENLKRKINQKDICYIEREQTKSAIYMVNHEYRVYETITALFERLDSRFVRIHQSYIVNLRYIERVEGKSVFLKNQMELPIGRTYKKDLMNVYFG